MEEGLVSIVVPTKNEEKRLVKLFDSLLTQSYKKYEVIINDDLGTSDKTAEVVKRYQKRFKIKYIRKNKGMAHGRKLGAKEARGEYLFHIDADMTLSPRVIEACVDEMRGGNDGCVVPEISIGQGYWAAVKSFEKSLYVGDEMMSSARFFRKRVYDAVGGHNEKMVLSEDKDLHLRIKKTGFKIVHIDEPIYHHEGSLNLWKDFKKKFFYGRTAHVFIKDHPDHSVKQANLIFRPAYFRNWKKLVMHPIMALSMFFMKGIEMFAAALGVLSTKLPIPVLDPWKK